ncbi:hypothetical protein TorRG33x02_028050, partial [Trema orientale]
LHLELDGDRDEVGLEQARDMGVILEGVGSDVLQHLGHHQTIDSCSFPSSAAVLRGLDAAEPEKWYRD